MSAALLIRRLREAGIQLSASGDRLHVEAPAGAVTAELRQRIAESKVELLAELRQPPTTTGDTRPDLLALADRLAVDRDHVHRLDDEGLALLAAIGEAGMRAFLLAAEDAVTRQAGKVPSGDTAAIYCQHCGPVYTHPAIAACLPVVADWPRAAGCPWCAIRKAGGYVPRACIACQSCASFRPDTVNPAAGVGACASGHGTHHPMQQHPCTDFNPRRPGANSLEQSP